MRKQLLLGLLIFCVWAFIITFIHINVVRSGRIVSQLQREADIKEARNQYEELEIARLSGPEIITTFASEKLAQSGTGANPGDSYLATITTALENSLSTPNSQKTLWVGGMGSGVRNKTNDKNTNPYSQYPADPSHQDGFYWVTGPEGLVTNENGTKGTKFWDTSKSYWNKDLKKSNYGEQVYGYTKWSSWSGGGQPDPDRAEPESPGSVGSGLGPGWRPSGGGV